MSAPAVGPFSRAELEDAFARFEQTVDDAAKTQDWDLWVAHYTPMWTTSSTPPAP